MNMNNNNPFFSKVISLKRILKGLTIGFPVTVMIFVISIYYFNLIDNSLRQHYLREVKVLGSQDDLARSDFSEFDEITGTLDIDEYVYNWNWELEGFRKASPYISMPIQYFSEDTSKFEREWILKDGYRLSMSCEEKRLDEIIPGYYYGCAIDYNGQLLDDYTRYNLYCPEDGTSCKGQVNLKLYSSEFGEWQYLILGNYAGGSYDEIKVFSLDGGEIVQIPFLTREEEKETWMITSGLVLEFYQNETEHRLVTQFHNAAINPVRVYRIWEINNGKLVLSNTIGSIIE